MLSQELLGTGLGLIPNLHRRCAQAGQALAMLSHEL